MAPSEFDSDPVEIPGYRSRRRRGGGDGRIVVVSALTSAIVSVGTVYLMLQFGIGLIPHKGASSIAGPAAAAPASVEVPKIVGMAVESATELLTSRQLQLVIQARRADADSAADIILEQKPLSESQIAPGQAVAVVVSSGAAEKTVPDVAGQSLDAAKTALVAAGFAVGPVTEVEGAKPGEVVATIPASGSSAAEGQAVSLSVGKAAEGVKLPKLYGIPISEAKKELSKLGLSVGKVQERYDSNFRAYIVLSQDPAEGSQVPVGSKVDLIINEGD